MDFPEERVKRFWAKVEKGPGCWDWTGGEASCGYGRFEGWPSSRRTHRIAYEIAFGPIPDGLCVCHHCDNPRCVRPDHLFLGTQADNVADMMKKGRHRAPTWKANSATRLDPQRVMEIRGRITAGQGLRSIARQLGVAYATVWEVAQGRTWTHV